MEAFFVFRGFSVLFILRWFPKDSKQFWARRPSFPFSEEEEEECHAEEAVLSGRSNP